MITYQNFSRSKECFISQIITGQELPQPKYCLFSVIHAQRGLLYFAEKGWWLVMLPKGLVVCHVAQRAGGLSCCPKGQWLVMLAKGLVACHVAPKAGGLSCCPKGWWLVMLPGGVSCHVAQRASGLSCCPKGWWLVMLAIDWCGLSHWP